MLMMTAWENEAGIVTAQIMDKKKGRVWGIFVVQSTPKYPNPTPPFLTDRADLCR
jgi:hypothetical protein